MDVCSKVVLVLYFVSAQGASCDVYPIEFYAFSASRNALSKLAPWPQVWSVSVIKSVHNIVRSNKTAVLSILTICHHLSNDEPQTASTREGSSAFNACFACLACSACLACFAYSACHAKYADNVLHNYIPNCACILHIVVKGI